MNHDYILGKEKIFTALMKLSIPATVAMLINAIYNIVDTIFVGREIGALGIAGVSVYLPLQMIMMSLASLIGVGTASIFSRKIGNNDLEGANKAFGNLILLVYLFSIFTFIFGFIFLEELVRFLGASNEVLPYAIDYARSILPGILFFPICVAANNIIRAEGSAKDAMCCMSIGMISNIFLDYLFICKLNMGITGAGLATSISKSLSFSYLTYYILNKSSVKLKLKYLKFDFSILKKIISIGTSAFITQVSISLVALLLNHSLVKYGGNFALSIYGIIYKLTLFIQMPLSGLVQGMQPIIGFSTGANNRTRVINTFKLTLIISTFIATTLTLIILIKTDMFMKLFTTDINLINEGSKVLKSNIIMYPFLGIYLTSIGFYQSIGKGKESLILSLLRQFIFFIPLSIILPSLFNLGIWGIWLAFPISDFLAFICTLVIAKITINKKAITPKIIN